MMWTENNPGRLQLSVHMDWKYHLRQKCLLRNAF